MTTIQDEVEAAELEGFFEVGHMPHLVSLYAAYKTHRAAEAAAKKAKGRTGDRILAELQKVSAIVFTIGGQPMMRRQVVEDKLIFDQKEFRKDHPALYEQYRTKTKKGSVRAWVRPQNGDDVTEEDDDDA